MPDETYELHKGEQVPREVVMPAARPDNPAAVEVVGRRGQFRVKVAGKQLQNVIGIHVDHELQSGAPMIVRLDVIATDVLFDLDANDTTIRAVGLRRDLNPVTRLVTPEEVAARST